MRTLRLALRFSLREMRGGLSGFMIFLACIALGVAAIGGVNSVAQAITAGVANQGQTLLGGDLRFQINQRSASDAELGFIKSLGTVSLNSGMRSMARLEDGSDQALVEAKAVDDAYPLYGTLETDPQLPRNELFGERSGIFGAAAPDLLFDRLNLHIGDRLKLGGATFELRARLVSEPDAISDGFGFAPRLMISHDGLVASGLVQPGSLVENAYKIRLPDGASEARIKGIQAEAAKDFPQAGWSIRT
ncbi:MAG: ABC transporter permease, partial [Mesorhizobium sp.]